MCSYIMLLTQLYCPCASHITGHALHEEGLQRKKVSVHPYLANKVDLCFRGHELTTVYWLAAHERA